MFWLVCVLFVSSYGTRTHTRAEKTDSTRVHILLCPARQFFWFLPLYCPRSFSSLWFIFGYYLLSSNSYVFPRDYFRGQEVGEETTSFSYFFSIFSFSFALPLDYMCRVPTATMIKSLIVVVVVDHSHDTRVGTHDSKNPPTDHQKDIQTDFPPRQHAVVVAAAAATPKETRKTTKNRQMKITGQDKAQHGTDAASHQRQEVSEIGNRVRHERRNTNDETPKECLFDPCAATTASTGGCLCGFRWCCYRRCVCCFFLSRVR